MALTRNPIVWLVGLFVLLVFAAGTFYTVPETEQAIVLRLGKPERIVNAYDPKAKFGDTDAGLVAKVPFIENVVYLDKRVLDLDMPQQTVLSTDQLRLVVDAFARFRIVDPQRMYETVGTEENAKDALARILASRLRNELGRQPFAALLSPQHADGGDPRQREPSGGTVRRVDSRRPDQARRPADRGPARKRLYADAFGPGAAGADHPRRGQQGGAARPCRRRRQRRAHLRRRLRPRPRLLRLLPLDAGVSRDVQGRHVDGHPVAEQRVPPRVRGTCGEMTTGAPMKMN
jgi:hypothetical protein